MGDRRGGSVESIVHDAFDEELQRAVVVRMVHPDLSARPRVRAEFRTLMQSVSSLHHPHVAAVLDWGEGSWNRHRVLYVVTEHLGGGSLRDVLDRGRLLSPSQALVVGLDVCKGLDALHKRQVIHGDVRPSTVVFGDDRRLRIVDPGISNILNAALGGIDTLSNDVAKYVAPERATGGAAEPVSDVYSLCLTLVESITGAVPFVGDSTVATLANRVDRLLPVSADLGPLAAVLEHAGRPTPDDRSTAAEFGRELVQVAPRMAAPEPLPLVGAAEPAPTRPSSESRPTTRTRRTPPPTEVLPPARQIRIDDPDDEDEVPAVWSTARGRRGLIGALVAVALVGGAVGWLATRPAQIVIPETVGLEAAEAKNLLADFEVTEASEPNDDIPVGAVIRTEPAAGATAAEGSAVTLVVSTGPAPRVLPDVTGQTIDAARLELEALGLVVEIAEPVFNEAIAAGVVISWSVDGSPTLVAGDTVLRGTIISLVVSAGKAPREVPDLTGLTVAAATAQLTALDLVAVRATDEFSPDVAAGAVIRQSPAPGVEIPAGGEVTIVVSKGPELIPFPDLTGLTGDAIITALTDAGFVVDEVIGDKNLALAYISINGAIVNKGQSVAKGSKVVVVFEAANN